MNSKMSLGYKIRREIADLKSLVRTGAYYFEYGLWKVFSTKKNVSLPKNSKEVLVINWGALGDVFCSMRVVYSLQKQNKNKKFTLAVDKSVIADVKKFEGKLGFKIKDIEESNPKDYDLILVFSASPDIKRFKEKFIVGNEYHSLGDSLKASQGSGRLFFNRKISPKFKHKLEQEIEIAKSAGLKLEKLESINLKNKFHKRRYAVIHPAGRNFSSIIKAGKTPAFAWPLERFSKISDYLIKEYDLDIIITGAKDEKFIGERVVEGVNLENRNRIMNYSGKLDVHALAEAISQAEILISIDTSSVHIAELTGTPVIALFGPSFPENNGAYGNPEKQINLQHKEFCIRDRKKGASYDKDNICMSSITVDELKNAIKKVI